MRRSFPILAALALIALCGAVAPRIDFTPLAPVKLIKPNGTVIGYGYGSATAAARGTALLAAQTAAVSGDLIRVDSDCTITAAIGKSGVRYLVLPGVTITRSDDAVGYMIDDGGANITFTVCGGIWRRTATAGLDLGDSPNVGVVRQTAASSNITFNFERVEVDSNATTGYSCAFFQSGGRINFSGHRVDVTGSTEGTGFWWENGEANGQVTELIGVADAGPGLFYMTVTDTPTGDFRLACDRIDEGADDALCIQHASSEAEAAIWITAHTIRGKVAHSGGKTYVTAQKLNGNLEAGGGKLYVNLQKQGGDFASSTPAILAGSGVAYLEINQFEPGTNWARTVDVSGGTNYLECQDLTAATGQDAVRVSGGTLNLLSGKVSCDPAQDDLVRSGGTLGVSPAVAYDPAKTSGTITPLPSAANQRTRLGLGTVATQDAAAVNITGGQVLGVTMSGNINSLTSPLEVDDGGSGANTLTGILKGNGTSPFTALTAPSGTIVGTTDTQTLSAKTLTGGSLTLNVNTTQTGNSGTSETDLASYTVPAGYLATNGDSVWFEAAGTFAATANTKQVRVRFGGGSQTLVFDSSGQAVNNNKWAIRGRIIRTGAATQKGYGQLTTNNSAMLIAGSADIRTNLDATLSGTNALRVTGTSSAASNDILIETFIVGANLQ
jgi:hypothetical protein